MVSEKNLEIRKELAKLDEENNEAYRHGKQTGNWSKFWKVVSKNQERKNALLDKLCTITSEGKNPLT